jgi:hypothetical protein
MCFGTRVLIYEKDGASNATWSFQLPTTGDLGSQGHLSGYGVNQELSTSAVRVSWAYVGVPRKTPTSLLWH